ncbi:MAG: PD-(D/E)XK nuclease family protein [Candidatus Sericytochromatia bacterium]|nr:PD-(D/E)XK nuclease family protein [Candidatus Sericytochromatia bacterium]
MPVLSVSALQAYWSCPRRYAYAYEGGALKLPDSSAASARGSAVHLKLHQHVLQPQNPAPLAEQDPALWQRYQAEIASYQAPEWRCYSEWACHVPLLPATESAPALWLTGRLDRVYVHASGERAVILDWKTGAGRPGPLNTLQLQAYAWLVWQARSLLQAVDLQQIEARAIWLEQDDQQLSQAYTPSELNDLSGQWQAMLADFYPLPEGLRVPRPRSDDDRVWCTMCEYQRLCPEGQHHAERYERPDLLMQTPGPDFSGL